MLFLKGLATRATDTRKREKSPKGIKTKMAGQSTYPTSNKIASAGANIIKVVGARAGLKAEHGKFGFYLTLTYMFVEYGRPMDLLPFLTAIRPAAIIIVLLLASLLTSPNLKSLKKPQIIYFTLFVLLCVVFIPLAHNGGIAYKQTISITFYLIFASSVVLHVNSLKRLRIFLSLWIILAIYISVKGIFHGSGEGIGGSSFLYDENDFALFLNVMLPFCLYMFMYEKAWLKKLFYLFSSFAFLGGIITSFSRGGFVGLSASLLVILMFSKKKLAAIFLTAALILILYVIGQTVSVNEVSYLNEMATIGNTEESTASIRIDAWTGAWHMFLDNPLGVGPANFPMRFPEYQPPTMNRNMWGFMAHSLWFTLIPELGIIGITIYSLWLYRNVRDVLWMRGLVKSKNPDLRLCAYFAMSYLAGLAGFFGSASFLSALYYPHYFYYSALIMATKQIAEQIVNNDASSSIQSHV